MLRLTSGVAAVFAFISLCATKAPAQSGAEDYQHYCAVCHGPDGKGKETTWNGELPDLTRLSRANGGRFPFKEVYEVVDGRDRSRWHQRQKGMPYWGFFFEPQEQNPEVQDPAFKAQVKSRITAIVDYVRTLQEK
jgi:mono/diheme cytochrome c family protein